MVYRVLELFTLHKYAQPSCLHYSLNGDEYMQTSKFIHGKMFTVTSTKVSHVCGRVSITPIVVAETDIKLNETRTPTEFQRNSILMGHNNCKVWT
jgi:hypothetical protein